MPSELTAFIEFSIVVNLFDSHSQKIISNRYQWIHRQVAAKVYVLTG